MMHLGMGAAVLVLWAQEAATGVLCSLTLGIIVAATKAFLSPFSPYKTYPALFLQKREAESQCLCVYVGVGVCVLCISVYAEGRVAD